MCAHVHGQLLNRFKPGESPGVSRPTIDPCLVLLEQTCLLRVLQPHPPDVKKRFVKGPKIFIRYRRLLHVLLGIQSQNDLLGHPACGASYEAFEVENAAYAHRRWRPYFHRSPSGAEIALVFEKGRKRLAVAAEASSSPEVERSFFNALADAKIDEARIAASVNLDFIGCRWWQSRDTDDKDQK